MKIPPFARAALAALALGLLAPRSGAGIFDRHRPRPTPPVVRQALALARDDRAQAIAILEAYLAHPADPELVPLVALNAGEQRRLAADPEAARRHFRTARRSSGDPEASAAALGLALLALDQGWSGNAVATLGVVPEGPPVPATMNADRFRILARRAAARGEPEPRVRELVRKALANAQSDPTVERRVRLSLADLLPHDAALDGAELAGAEERALRGARSALERGELAAAIRRADQALSAFPDGTRTQELHWIQRLAGAGNPYHSDRIGVLLPLTGTYGPAGQQVRADLEMALGGSATLIFRDTGGDPDKALAAFQELVLQRGIAALVGPLLKQDAIPVAAEAQAAGVPVVVLSQVPGITGAGDRVFRGLLTPSHQVRALLDRVMDEEAMSRFGVMAPDTPYGHSTTDEFSRQVAERGGQVVRVVFYDTADTDYRPAAAELGAKDYRARAGELARLRRQAEDQGMDPDKVVLPPRVDFDAIFVPDGARRVPLVAAALTYEEFPVGAFRPRLHMKTMPMLGLNAWHDPAIAVQGGLAVRHAIFVDAFSPELPDPAVQAFVSAWHAERDGEPGVLDALVYDTGRIVALAVGAEPAGRGAFRDALAAARLPQPVAGGGSFDEHREIQRRLHVFTIEEGGIELADAPEGPDPAAP